MSGLAVTEEELRSLLVTDLEVLSGEDFDHARSLAHSRRMPLERAAALSSTWEGAGPISSAASSRVDGSVNGASTW